MWNFARKISSFANGFKGSIDSIASNEPKSCFTFFGASFFKFLESFLISASKLSKKSFILSEDKTLSKTLFFLLLLFLLTPLLNH